MYVEPRRSPAAEGLGLGRLRARRLVEHGRQARILAHQKCRLPVTWLCGSRAQWAVDRREQARSTNLQDQRSLKTAAQGKLHTFIPPGGRNGWHLRAWRRACGGYRDVGRGAFPCRCHSGLSTTGWCSSSLSCLPAIQAPWLHQTFFLVASSAWIDDRREPQHLVSA